MSESINRKGKKQVMAEKVAALKKELEHNSSTQKSIESAMVKPKTDVFSMRPKLLVILVGVVLVLIVAVFVLYMIKQQSEGSADALNNTQDSTSKDNKMTEPAKPSLLRESAEFSVRDGNLITTETFSLNGELIVDETKEIIKVDLEQDISDVIVLSGYPMCYFYTTEDDGSQVWYKFNDWAKDDVKYDQLIGESASDLRAKNLPINTIYKHIGNSVVLAGDVVESEMNNTGLFDIYSYDFIPILDQRFDYYFNSDEKVETISMMSWNFPTKYYEVDAETNRELQTNKKAATRLSNIQYQFDLVQDDVSIPVLGFSSEKAISGQKVSGASSKYEYTGFTKDGVHYSIDKYLGDIQTENVEVPTISGIYLVELEEQLFVTLYVHYELCVAECLDSPGADSGIDGAEYLFSNGKVYRNTNMFITESAMDTLMSLNWHYDDRMVQYDVWDDYINK